jgi:DNA helicase-2/ATP-dependent DNA helicase PcrA
MKKMDMELKDEKQRLEEVVEIIKEETINFIAKRKGISESIIKYRREAVDEFKNDEDQVAEYFDHERYINEEAFKMIDRKLKELTVLRETPYFAKIVFKETDEEEQLYIGRFGLNRENDFEPVIVDWRAPVASVFYAGKIGRLSYTAPMGEIFLDVISKRQFIIKKGKLEGMFDSTSEIKDEILQMILSKNTGEKLKDIIMTIQEEQDKLIRYDRNKTIVVDGVAGSGKTTIALHRVAYLLYNYRNILENKVLIIGPNNIFMDYISNVLPSLGEVGVKQTTFREFVLDIINIDNIISFEDSMERVINGDKNFIEDFKYKESEEFVKVLDNLVNDLDDSCFNIQDVSFFDILILSSDEIKKMFKIHFKDMPLFRRSKKIRRIIFSKIKDESYSRVNEIKRQHEEKIKSLSQADLEIEENHLEFLRKIKVKEVIKEAMNVKKKLEWIINPKILQIYNGFNKYSTLTFEDLSPILYLSIKLEGLKLEDDIKHIVIDEAQDFSFLQFKVLKEITNCKSFTVVGDTNQRLIPLEGNSAMLNLEKIYKECDIEHFKLQTSYRSTRQIMEYSNKFLKSGAVVPVVRDGSEVQERNFENINELVNNIIGKIKEYKQKGFESVAVICKSIVEAETIGDYIKRKMYIKVFDNENSTYKGGDIIIPSYYAKGLEFDCVINVFSQDGGPESNEQNRLKYVMATRALHEMCWYQLPLGGIVDV